MIKRYYTIDEAIAYLSEINRHPISRRDIFHLISEKKLRLCFVYIGSFAVCDDDCEFVAKITGFLEFKGYAEVPLTYLQGIESAITFPSENATVYCGSFDGFCLPFEQFDKSNIPNGSYYFCDSMMRFDGKQYIGMDWLDACKKHRDTRSHNNEFSGPDVGYHDALIPAVDIDNLLIERTPPQEAQRKEDSLPPEAQYTTRLLNIQAQAIQKFWVRYDPAEPDTAPDSKAIIQWLKDEGCSGEMATAIDKIIRHDTRKSGGAKPKN